MRACVRVSDRAYVRRPMCVHESVSESVRDSERESVWSWVRSSVRKVGNKIA